MKVPPKVFLDETFTSAVSTYFRPHIAAVLLEELRLSISVRANTHKPFSTAIGVEKNHAKSNQFSDFVNLDA